MLQTQPTLHYFFNWCVRLPGLTMYCKVFATHEHCPPPVSEAHVLTAAGGNELWHSVILLLWKVKTEVNYSINVTRHSSEDVCLQAADTLKTLCQSTTSYIVAQSNLNVQTWYTYFQIQCDLTLSEDISDVHCEKMWNLIFRKFSSTACNQDVLIAVLAYS